MPGIDKSRFIGLRQSDEELLCGICLAILNQPLVTPCCSQTYCGDCLRQWLQKNDTCPNDRQKLDAKDVLQPPRLIKNMLDKLEIKCEFSDKGCDNQISLGRLKEHVKVCGFNPDAICLVCGDKNGDLDEHDCNSNLLAKAKSLEISNEELTKKHNAYVANTTKQMKDNEKLIDELNKKINNSRGYVEDIRDRNAKLNEENKRLKSDKRAANKKLKTMADFSAKSNRQLNDSIKKLTDLRTEFTEINRNFRCTDTELDVVVNRNNREEASKQENAHLVCVAFQYRVEDVRSLRTVGFDYSPPMFAHGFKWRIKAGHYTESEQEYLKFFLECNNCNKSTKWSFDAIVKLKIMGTNPANRAYERHFTHKFTNVEADWGYQRFMLLSKIFDPQNGCSADNSINLEAIISPDIQANADFDSVIDSDSDSDSDSD